MDYDEEAEVLGELGAREDADAVDGLRDRVVEVVDDGDEETLLEELEHGVRPDEASASRHEDAPLLLLTLRHGRGDREEGATHVSREGKAEGFMGMCERG